jgi:hypothetical protein
MTIIGRAIDYSDARPPLDQVKAAGYTDVYRYTRTFDSAGKRLGPTERDQILDAGLDIGIHGEDQSGDAANGAARGTLRGTAWANYMHDVLQAPKGMVIVAAVDYDTLGNYPNAVDDYLGAVEAAFQGEYRLGVYGSYWVITGAQAAGRGEACYVMTNAWGPDTPPSFCHLHQHGGTPFPNTDNNDILRNPRGTWLQTLGKDPEMMLDPTDPIVIEIRKALSLDTAHPGTVCLGDIWRMANADNSDTNDQHWWTNANIAQDVKAALTKLDALITGQANLPQTLQPVQDAIAALGSLDLTLTADQIAALAAALAGALPADLAVQLVTQMAAHLGVQVSLTTT